MILLSVAVAYAVCEASAVLYAVDVMPYDLLRWIAPAAVVLGLRIETDTSSPPRTGYVDTRTAVMALIYAFPVLLGISGGFAGRLMPLYVVASLVLIFRDDAKGLPALPPPEGFTIPLSGKSRLGDQLSEEKGNVSY